MSGGVRKPRGGLVAAADMESLEATLELLSDPEAQRRIANSEAEIASGDVFDEEAIAPPTPRRGRAE